MNLLERISFFSTIGLLLFFSFCFSFLWHNFWVTTFFYFMASYDSEKGTTWRECFDESRKGVCGLLSGSWFFFCLCFLRVYTGRRFPFLPRKIVEQSIFVVVVDTVFFYSSSVIIFPLQSRHGLLWPPSPSLNHVIILVGKQAQDRLKRIFTMFKQGPDRSSSVNVPRRACKASGAVRICSSYLMCITPSSL